MFECLSYSTGVFRSLSWRNIQTAVGLSGQDLGDESGFPCQKWRYWIRLRSRKTLADTRQDPYPQGGSCGREDQKAPLGQDGSEELTSQVWSPDASSYSQKVYPCNMGGQFFRAILSMVKHQGTDPRQKVHMWGM